MDLRSQYVKESAKQAGKVLRIPIERDSPGYTEVVKFFGTSSPKEMAQILIGLATDVNAGRVKIVEA